MGKTLFDKVWDSHVIERIEDGPDVLFIDKHFIHEVTSPVAFVGLKNRNLKVMYPHRTFATADHNTPTINQHLPIKDRLSAMQVKTLEKNCNEHGIDFWGLGHKKNGIVHVIGPENGITQPGLTIVCGDSHTSTHGAFGAIAFGIGTSEVEMVLACQTIMQQKPMKMKINVDGKLSPNVTPKDVAIYIISKLSSSGATGYFVEYAGSVFKNMSMEGRMTVCNLSIEMGARGGMIAPDDKTFDYIEGREYAPKGDEWTKAVNYWKTLKTDKDAIFDKEYNFKADEIEPMITYGTKPGMAIPISKSRKKSSNVNAWLVPGSHKVLKSIRDEGILDILTESGFKLREPGCSACLAMNDDKIPKGKYAVSTTNRNFEGRQGPGARTLLASPLVAAATAITGEITDPRDII